MSTSNAKNLTQDLLTVVPQDGLTSELGVLCWDTLGLVMLHKNWRLEMNKKMKPERLSSLLSHLLFLTVFLSTLAVYLLAN